ncbi:MAG: formyltransferase family protein [Candidatus Berkelbacteria bacterium]|nr:formyltransferase family protein [Candidatus Berkelbacteria bacterium]
MPRVLVFASGSKDGGGSGFRNLVLRSRGENPDLIADIVGVVSNHKDGGVRRHAEELGVPFEYFGGPYQARTYRRIVNDFEAEWVALSGWLKLVRGLNPRTTFNIHPGPLPEFGGEGMYGHKVHEAVIAAFKRGEITKSAVTMHFVTDRYDEGPTFFRFPVPIYEDDTPGSLQQRVNEFEHQWQPIITSCVVNSQISWNGLDPKSLIVSSRYQEYLP